MVRRLLFSYVSIACSVGACVSGPPASSDESALEVVQPPVPLSLPDGVAARCPSRTIQVECWKENLIEHAMQGLGPGFIRCFRALAVPGRDYHVRLEIETLAGRAFCVDVNVRSDPVAACLASVVARHLRIPADTPQERCQFIQPVSYHGGAEGR